MPNPLQSLMNRIAGMTPAPANDLGRVILAAQERADWAQVYGLLELYYANNALYDSLQRRLYESGVWHESMKALRNPTYRVVEFYASKLFGGFADELKIESENDRLEPAIRKLWRWSNWGTKKTLAARQLAMFGDQFIKVAQNESGSRVFFQFLHPATVTDFDLDDRDNITWIRIDVVQKTTRGLAPAATMYTEVWSKADQRLTVWLHTKSPQTPLAQLPPPVRVVPFAELGFDFVPIVHSRFKDVGDKRGRAAIWPALDKIDEANRVATRLHGMQFRSNTVTWALQANQVGADGRPWSAPRVQPDDPATEVTESGSVAVGEEKMYRLPGNTTLVPLVPNLQYDAMLATLLAHMQELENDLPELAYYRIREMSDPSGRAVRTMLSDTIDRALEARGNHYDGVKRSNMMGLTMGQAAGIPGFEALGDFDQDDLEHSIEGPEIIATSDFEKAETQNMQAAALNALHDLGVSRETLIREAGYDPEAEALQREDEDQAGADTMLTAFDRGARGLGAA